MFRNIKTRPNSNHNSSPVSVEPPKSKNPYQLAFYGLAALAVISVLFFAFGEPTALNDPQPLIPKVEGNRLSVSPNETLVVQIKRPVLIPASACHYYTIVPQDVFQIDNYRTHHIITPPHVGQWEILTISLYRDNSPTRPDGC